MATHRPEYSNPKPGSPVAREPVAIADAVKALAAIGAAFGWAMDDAVVSTITTVVSGVVFLVATFWTRRTVTSPATLRARYTHLVSGRLDEPGLPGDETL